MKSADFVRVFGAKVAAPSGCLVLFGYCRTQAASEKGPDPAESEESPSQRTGREDGRLGLAVGRSVGNAVARNLIKRRLREAFRSDREACRGLDVVVRARTPAGSAGFQDLERDFRSGLRRLAKRLPC